MIDPKMPPADEPPTNDQAQGPDSENDKEDSGVLHGVAWIMPVSYTHLTLPTNREV